MRAFTLITMVLWLTPGFCGAYKWVDENGVVQYSDRPVGEDAQEVSLPPASHYQPPEYSIPEPDAQAAAPANPYDEMVIVKPQPEATVRDNSGNVEVEVALTPTLRKGDTMTVLLDGQVFAESVSNRRMVLQAVDRGTHQLQVKVLGPQGAQLASTPTVTFHLHRAIAPKPQPQPKPQPR